MRRCRLFPPAPRHHAAAPDPPPGSAVCGCAEGAQAAGGQAGLALGLHRCSSPPLLNAFGCVLVSSMFQGIFTNDKLELKQREAVANASYMDKRQQPHMLSGTMALIKTPNCL